MIFARYLPVFLAFALVLPGCVTPSRSSAAFEKRVQRLEDEKQIREVVIRYGEYLDARDYAGYASRRRPGRRLAREGDA